jgi:hypothetical protein
MREGRAAPPPGVWLLVVALVTCAAWAVAWWPNTVDDAFIVFRYAANLAAGHGAVFNPGERVEGYSSPLWMATLAGAAFARAHVETVSKVLGLACSLGGLLVLGLALIRSGARIGIAGAAALVIAGLPTMHLYQVSGLETAAFFAALVTAACAGAVHDGPARLPVIVPATIAVGLLRPEGLLLAVALVAGWAPRLRRPRAVQLIVWVALPLLAFVLVRHFYYGAWLPNTWYVKPAPLLHLLETGDPAAWAALARGWRHNVWDAFDEAGGIVVIGLALPALGSRDWPGVAALVAIVGFGLVSLMPADWMPGHRYALPFMALAIVAAAWTVDHAVERWAARGRGAGWALAALVVLWMLRATLAGVDDWRNLVVGAGHPALAAQRVYRPIGEWLATHSPSDRSVLAYEVGAVGYYSRLRVVDHEGLIHPGVAREVRRAGESGAVRTGRDARAMERVIAICLGEHPDWFLVRTRGGPAPPAGGALPAALAADSIQRTLVRRLGAGMVVAASFPLGGPPSAGGYVLLRRTVP